MPIRVKNTLAKKVLKKCNKARAFWVIVKVSFEHVLYVGWVGCNDAVDFSGTAEDGGVGGATRENFGAPVEKTKKKMKGMKKMREKKKIEISSVEVMTVL
ncbi:hypothetical protein AgCh_036597 [Apium graveolens]